MQIVIQVTVFKIMSLRSTRPQRDDTKLSNGYYARKYYFILFFITNYCPNVLSLKVRKHVGTATTLKSVIIFKYFKRHKSPAFFHFLNILMVFQENFLPSSDFQLIDLAITGDSVRFRCQRNQDRKKEKNASFRSDSIGAIR